MPLLSATNHKSIGQFLNQHFPFLSAKTNPCFIKLAVLPISRLLVQLCAMWGLLGGCIQPSFEIKVPLAIVHIAPHDGANGVDVRWNPVICFNLPVEAEKAQEKVVLEKYGQGEVQEQSLQPAESENCLIIMHGELDLDQQYVIRVKQGLVAADGSLLATEISTTFRTATN